MTISNRYEELKIGIETRKIKHKLTRALEQQPNKTSSEKETKQERMRRSCWGVTRNWIREWTKMTKRS
jgi:hypothetical protein